MTVGKPAAEVDISENLVRRLLDAQHPDLADLPIAPLASGWDNAIYRLGNELTVRVPRRLVAAPLVKNEQAWLPVLQPSLPLPIPVPLRIGTATEFYPWHWSVLPWFAGEPADLQPPAGTEAVAWADFLLALHQSAPADAPINDLRGVPATARAEAIQERIDRLQDKTDLFNRKIAGIWQTGLAAAESSEKRWLHGDLHAQNVLVNAGQISAVIDWGDITTGDEATDLASVWSLFDDSSARNTILERYAPDQALLQRARAWAVMFGVVLLDSGLINSPRHAAMGECILRRLDEDC